MEKHLVSIGIPAYNRPDKLKRTLRCIQEQTYANLEIIISDDCSPDKKVEQVVLEAMANDKRIIFYRQNVNLGATGNTDFLIRQATGEYFFWSDDEDLLSPNFVEEIVKCMDSDPDLVLCACDVVTVDDHDNFIANHQLSSIRTSYKWNDVRKLFFRYPTTNIFFCIHGIFRTTIIKKISIKIMIGWRGYETNGEVPYLAQLATLGKITSIPQALKTYRLNPDSIYHTEMRMISKFDMLMLRMIIRIKIIQIAVQSQLALTVKINLVSVVLLSHLQAVFAGLKGALFLIMLKLLKAIKINAND